jgi:hypothetical protein
MLVQLDNIEGVGDVAFDACVVDNGLFSVSDSILNMIYPKTI